MHTFTYFTWHTYHTHIYILHIAHIQCTHSLTAHGTHTMHTFTHCKWHTYHVHIYIQHMAHIQCTHLLTANNTHIMTTFTYCTGHTFDAHTKGRVEGQKHRRKEGKDAGKGEECPMENLWGELFLRMGCRQSTTPAGRGLEGDTRTESYPGPDLRQPVWSTWQTFFCTIGMWGAHAGSARPDASIQVQAWGK